MEAIADLLYELPKNYGLVFDVAHYVVCLQAERADLGPNFETDEEQTTGESIPLFLQLCSSLQVGSIRCKYSSCKYNLLC